MLCTHLDCGPLIQKHDLMDKLYTSEQFKTDSDTSQVKLDIFKIQTKPASLFSVVSLKKKWWKLEHYLKVSNIYFFFSSTPIETLQ